MQELKGIAASDGTALASAYVFEQPKINWEVIQARASVGHPREYQMYQEAATTVADSLNALADASAGKTSDENLEIFRAQALMATDAMLAARVEELIKDGHNATYALYKSSKLIADEFRQFDDEYLRERAYDVEEVSMRIIYALEGVVTRSLANIDSPVIIIAHDLTPADTIQLNREYVKGFITEVGGRTSHSAIVARSMGIPAVLSVPQALAQIRQGVLVGLNGMTGSVWIDPNAEVRAELVRLQEQMEEDHRELQSYLTRPSITRDSRRIELGVNVGSVSAAIEADKVGYDTIGLVRSEFLYMEADNWPTEEEQYQAYKSILQSAGDRKVVIRTLDIGGDKELSYHTFESEMNPFLGYRAIRLCLDKQDMFRTQLRALARAAEHGRLAIMFPMIATVDEFKAARELFNECHRKLVTEGLVRAETLANIEVGMMVEVPAAAVLADEFSKYADFFSIGSNDLIQYTMAADRMSQKVTHLYQPLHPSILRLINYTIQGARYNNRWVGMCGEMGSDPHAFVLLVAMGIHEISMSPSVYLKNKRLLSKLDSSSFVGLLADISAMDTEAEIRARVENFIQSLD